MPSYKYKLKLAVIADYENGVTQQDIFEKYYAIDNRLTRYRTDTWIWQRDDILSKQSEAKKNRTLTSFSKKTRIDTNRKTLLGMKNEDLIDNWIKLTRDSGKAVSNNDIKVQALKIATDDNIVGFTASNGWMNGFKKRYNYVMRRVTKANKITVEEKETVIDEFHKELEEKDKSSDFFLPKFGTPMKQ